MICYKNNKLVIIGSIILFMVVSIMVIIILYKKDEIEVTIYEAPGENGYIYEIMNDGIIEFKERKEKGGVLGKGYNVTWVFKILNPGKVRIKWVCQDSVQKWKNSGSWIDKYTINADKSYSVERLFLDERVFYFLCYSEELNNDTVYKGYFIDINGNKRFYNFEDTNKEIETVNDILLYLTMHFEEYPPVEFIKNEDLKRCNRKLNLVDKDYVYSDLNIVYGKLVFYAIYESAEKEGYVICSEEDHNVEDENIKAIMDILGNDWDKYEP